MANTKSFDASKTEQPRRPDIKVSAREVFGIESDLEVRAGYFDVFSASGNLKELLGKRCQYGLNVTKEKSFVMQGFCK